MAIEAPMSKQKKTNFIIVVVVLLALSAWFAYDGYLNDDFIKKHTKEDGTPTDTLKFNRYGPFIGVVAVLGLTVHFVLTKDQKLVADEEGLKYKGRAVPYDRIEKVNKTNFEEKGSFTISYKDDSGRETDWRLCDRRFDNLSAVLDKIVEKIS